MYKCYRTVGAKECHGQGEFRTQYHMHERWKENTDVSELARCKTTRKDESEGYNRTGSGRSRCTRKQKAKSKDCGAGPLQEPVHGEQTHRK